MEASYAQGVLPPPRTGQAAEVELRNMPHAELLLPFQGLSSIRRDDLKSLVDAQRKQFAKGGTNDADPGMGDFTPPQDAAGRASAATEPAGAPQARFDLSMEFRRPSDFVAHLARKFEAGIINPETKQVEPRPKTQQCEHH